MSGRFSSIKRQVTYGLAAVSIAGAGFSLVHFSFISKNGLQLYQASGTSVVRRPARQAPKIQLSAAVDLLFATQGKNDRADFVQRRIGTARGPVDGADRRRKVAAGSDDDLQFVAASLTPVDMGRPGPTRTAGMFRQAVNRDGKGDPLAPPDSIAEAKPEGRIVQASLNASTPVREIERASEAEAVGDKPKAAEDNVDEAKAAADETDQKPPVTTASTSPADEAESQDDKSSVKTVKAPEAEAKPAKKKSTWEDLIELARVDGGDGRKIKPRIFGALSEDEFRAREFRCMATAIYFEARGESTKGQIAVGQVIMTRVRSDYYPNTICGVVFQGQWNRNACQFSFACDGRTDSPRNRKQWSAAIDVAKKVISGEVYIKEVDDATHYHATYVSPDWRKMMKRVSKIGVHIFYKADFAKPLVASTELDNL